MSLFYRVDFADNIKLFVAVKSQLVHKLRELHGKLWFHRAGRAQADDFRV